jgi:hypothetical protein
MHQGQLGVVQVLAESLGADGAHARQTARARSLSPKPADQHLQAPRGQGAGAVALRPNGLFVFTLEHSVGADPMPATGSSCTAGTATAAPASAATRRRAIQLEIAEADLRRLQRQIAGLDDAIPSRSTSSHGRDGSDHLPTRMGALGASA